MKTSKKIMVAGALSLPLLALSSFGVASAMSDNTGDGLAAKIATRFNLKEDEVKSFLKEEHEKKHQEMQEQAKEALLKAGFTEAQVKALQDKREAQRSEMQTWREANPNATRDEAKTQRDKQRDEFEAWAKEQGIDTSKLKDALKELGHGGRRHGPRF